MFCVTAMLTKFYAELFQSLGSPVLEIHSRKSQSARTKAADAFRVGSQACCSADGVQHMRMWPYHMLDKL